MTQVLDNTQGRVCIIEQAWLSRVLDINNKGKHDGKWQLDQVPVTYAGLFSNKQVDEIRPRAVIGVFPMFTEEKSDTLSMQKHTMLVVKKAINFVNPGQTPALEGNCPLYAHKKWCQFLFPEEVGERQIVYMIGFLHLEMCAQEVGGEIVRWIRMGENVRLSQDFLSWRIGFPIWWQACPGDVEWLFDHISLAGSIEATCLWYLLSVNWPAWTIGYVGTVDSLHISNTHTSASFAISPKGNCPGTLESIEMLCPYFLAFGHGHTNFSRWVPVFLRDMAQLPSTSPWCPWQFHVRSLRGPKKWDEV